MVRVVTQETYEEIVKENMEEFDMTREEAILNAVAQFEAQGVDLSNIIKDLQLGSHLVTDVLNELKILSKSTDNREHIIKQIDVLVLECKKDMARKLRAGKDGAYDVLLTLLRNNLENYSLGNKNVDQFILKTLECLICLMDGQPDLLERSGIELMKRALDSVENEKILCAILKWASVCCLKHEINRQRIFVSGIETNLKSLLQDKREPEILSETLQVVRKLTLDDDIRLEFGKAHEHARDLGLQLMEPLTDILIEKRVPSCTGEVLLTISSLLVRNELCANAARCSDALFAILADYYDDVTTIQHAVKLITALAGNDDVKRQLVKSGIIPIIVSLLGKYSNNPTTAALLLKCIAVVALREPLHSKMFLDNDAPEALVECLRIHQTNPTVQKNGCWAIRNIVARCRDQNLRFHTLGIEAILKTSHDLFEKDFGFDIRSALRDLECDVTLVEQWTGKGVEIDK